MISKPDLARLTQLLALIALLTACGVGSFSQGGSVATLPPTIISADLVEEAPMDPVELPQLIGLSEEAATQWAYASGFEEVRNDRDPPGPEVLAIADRLTLTTDADDVVTKALAG